MRKRILLFALALLTVVTFFLPAISARAVTVRASSDALVSKMKAREGFACQKHEGKKREEEASKGSAHTA